MRVGSCERAFLQRTPNSRLSTGAQELGGTDKFTRFYSLSRGNHAST